jgi:hypothetical protein
VLLNAIHNIRGARAKFEPDKAHSTAPLVEIGLTVTQNLDKARALEALVAVAPLNIVSS